MTDQAQSIAIAEASGIRFCEFVPQRDVPSCCSNCGWNHHILGVPVDDQTKRKIADYPNDLNAIAAAEQATLTTERLREVYAHWLYVLSHPDHWTYLEPEEREPHDYIGWIEQPADKAFVTYTASARIRCEALLRTLKLWTP